jgi:NAD(P)-dependent dehydrogenase (short-subunit alcohol dehydrogenase family)
MILALAEQLRRATVKRIPLRRCKASEEAAELIAFLASPHTMYQRGGRSDRCRDICAWSRYLG